MTVPPPDTSIRPGADFYMHVNAAWHRDVKFPKFEDSFGVSEEIEADVRNALLHAIDETRRAHPSAPLSKLATSFLDAAVQRNSVLGLQQLLKKVDCVEDAAGIGKLIGDLNLLQIKAPVSFVVNSDYYDSDKCCVYLHEAPLGLPSKAYYKEHDGATLARYRRFLTTVGRLLGVADLETVITTEVALEPFVTDRGSDGGDTTYNPHTFAELTRSHPHMDWAAALTTWGLTAAEVPRQTYVITNPRYFHELDRLLATGNIETLRTWFRSIIVVHFVKYLPPPYDDYHYTLFDHALKGVAIKQPQPHLTLKVLMDSTKEDLGKMFVHLGVPAGTKEKATRLVERLKAATAARIRGLAWMSAATKRTALEKVDALKFQVAYPESWKSETATVAKELSPTTPLANLLVLAKQDTAEMLADLRATRCRKTASKWLEGVFEVNAYYYPDGNLMVVPAGILRPPFFDVARSHAWNLGGIGAAIGHEITHGFDDDGRMFDGNGDYKDWWTPDDARTYKRMSAAMVDLFEGQTYMGGKVNGTLTLSENLADLGGLAIALEALKGTLPKDGAAAHAALREFFTSYAVSWRQVDRPQKAKQALLIDVHAPPPLRVNLIVRQFQEFYDAFGIGEGDEGYVAPADRITFW